MKPKEELRQLRSILRYIDAPSMGPFGRKWFRLALWFLLVGLFLSLFQLAERFYWSTEVVVFVAAMIGFVTGGLFFSDVGFRNFMLIRRYLKRDEIEARINELDSGGRE